MHDDVLSRTGDVVTRTGDETVLTDKTGRRFVKADNSSAGGDVSMERLILRALVLCSLSNQESKQIVKPLERVVFHVFFGFVQFEKYAISPTRTYEPVYEVFSATILPAVETHQLDAGMSVLVCNGKG